MPRAAKATTAGKAGTAKKTATTAAKKTTSAAKTTAKSAGGRAAAPSAAKSQAKKATSTKAPVKATSKAATKATTKSPAKATKATKATKAPAPSKASSTTKAPGAAKASPATKAVAKAKKPVLDKFMLEQQTLLLEERATYTQQAEDLKAEADQMAADAEPGDVQFDEESGEGGTTNIDRERDLALVAQARQAVEEIDYALEKIANGTYGDCETCGKPIIRARLRAIPHARQCVDCKSGGLSRR